MNPQRFFIGIAIGVLLVAIVGGGIYFFMQQEPVLKVATFGECVAAGNPVMESYPRQCRHGEQTFTEDVGNELEKANFIRIDSPRPGEVVRSPLVITGSARGSWFFEASFPVYITNWDGLIIGEGIATAKDNWMTSEFVPYEATLTFSVDKNTYSNRGTLILKKDNPSGLSEHDDALEIPVVLAGVTEDTPPINQKPITRCTKDSDCSSSQYVCQETQGSGTVCSSTDPSCVPTHAVIQGECKLKEGNRCTEDSDCISGNLCNKNVCTSPIGRRCGGSNDTSCPVEFTCVQGCGSPVAYPDEPPPPYFCQLNGYIRSCPICLAKNTLIDTPQGWIAVEDLKKGAPVWTVDNSGKRVSGVVVETSKTPVPIDHKMVKLVLQDGRTLLVSPGHPTTDGRRIEDLSTGDVYDGTQVISVDRVAYDEGFTYDILSSGETGFYFANGVLLDSTLHVQAAPRAKF